MSREVPVGRIRSAARVHRGAAWIPRDRGHRGWAARWTPARRDRGQISVLIIGLFAVTLVLVIGALDVTAVNLARIRLVDVADAAALDAADALDERAAYVRGLPDAVAVSNETVAQAATGYLAARQRPDGISSWTLAPGTGADAGTAVVVLEATVDIPMTGGILAALGRSVTIHVHSRARAPLRAP